MKIRVVENIKTWIRIAKMPNAASWLKIVEDIMKFAEEASKRKTPVLTKIAGINYSIEQMPKEMDIVHLWASTGSHIDPIKRLSHLRNQIDGLRELLEEAKKIIPDTEENKTLLMNIFLMMKCTD